MMIAAKGRRMNGSSMRMALGVVMMMALVLLGKEVGPCQGIVGGYDRNISEVPYMAAIIVQSGSEEPNAGLYIKCAGTFINSLWVLTDFACVRKAGTTLESRYEIDKKYIFVGFGHTTRHELVTGFLMKVRKVVVNRDYNRFALLKLNRNVTFAAGNVTNFTHSAPYWVAPIEIADAPPSPGDFVEVAGWGAINKDGFGVTPSLQSINGTLLNNTDCNNDNPNILCFGNHKPRRDASSTDQGAPLVNALGQQVGFYTGSEGGYIGGEYSTGRGLYLRTDIVKAWINETTSDLSFTAPASSLLLSFSSLFFCLFFFFLFSSSS